MYQVALFKKKIVLLSIVLLKEGFLSSIQNWQQRVLQLTLLTSALLPINFFLNWMFGLRFERVAGGIFQNCEHCSELK